MSENPWRDDLEAIKQRMTDTQGILTEIGEQVILPALGRRYGASGLKRRSGRMYSAVAERGARGNVFQVTGNRLTVGIDYNEVPHAKFQLEGTKSPIRPKRAKALRIPLDDGTVIFRKWVRGVPAKLIYYLDASDIAKANELLAAAVGGDAQVRDTSRWGNR